MLHSSRRIELLVIVAGLTGCLGSAQAQPQPDRAGAVRAEPPTLAIDEVVVTGNTLLPQVEIDRITVPLRGRRTLADLQAAATRLQERYRQAGWGAVVAYVPEQTVSDGRARIAVLEGKVARVVVTGNRRFDSAAVRRSLPHLQEGVTPRIARIDTEVQFANENPARQLAVVLEPGALQGQVDARVSVIESDPSRWTLSADNTGTSRTGKARLGVNWLNSALWGLDHQLQLQVQTSPSQPSAVKIGAVSYRMPFYSRSVAVETYAGYSSVNAGTSATAAGALSFSGQGRVFGVRSTLTPTRRGEWDQRIGVALERRDYRNACSIAGLPAGACGSAGQSVSVLPLMLEYSAQRGGAQPLGLSLALAHNALLVGEYGHADDIALVRPGGKAHYTALRWGGFASRPLEQDWRLELRAGGQFSRDGLIPGEQYSIAGALAVRGYAEREVTGDSALVASAELRTPNLADGRIARLQSARLLGFADLGRAWNRLDTPCNGTAARCSLASFGVGLRATAAGAQLRLDLASPLKAGTLTQRHSVQVHVQVVYVLP